MSRQQVGAVIATKDRPGPLRRTLHSLATQDRKPDATVVVDASTEPEFTRHVVREAADDLKLCHVLHSPPSAAAQRNRGVRTLPEEYEYIAFFDDDIWLKREALGTAAGRLSQGDEDLLAIGFNERNPPAKASKDVPSWLMSYGLYPSTPGAVAPSGWHRIAADVESDLRVDWLPSTAVLWKRSAFKERGFEEKFKRYSYLEDLEFSYWAGHKGKLVVCAEAEYLHLPSDQGRVGRKEFGVVEVKNRIIFVRRHNLDQKRMAAMMAFRIAKTGYQALRHQDHDSLKRLQGNLSALLAWVRNTLNLPA